MNSIINRCSVLCAVLALVLCAGTSHGVFVESASLIDNNTVRIYYSEAVDDTAENTSNYSLNPSAAVTGASRRDGNTVAELTLGSAVTDGVVSTVTVSGVTGLSGKSAAMFTGVNPDPLFMDDCNRPAGSVLLTHSPEGKWNNVTTESGNNVNLISSIKYAGDCCFYMADNSAAGSNAYLVRDLTFPGTVYARLYVNLPGGFFAAMANSNQRSLFEIRTDDASIYAALRAYKNGSGTQQLMFIEFPGWTNNVFSPVSEDTWYCFEVALPSCTSNSTLNWWIDGSPQTPISSLDLSGAGYWDRIYAGLGWTNTASITQTMYMDELVVRAGPLITGGGGGEPPPPEGMYVMSASLTGANTVRLYYSEAADATAENTGNYSIVPARSITSAVRAESNKAVDLTISGTWDNNRVSTVTVSGVTGLQDKFTASFVGYNPYPQFADDFNRPYGSFLSTDTVAGPWNGRNTESGCITGSTSTMKAGGDYAFYCKDDSASNSEAYLQKDLNITDGYVRFYMWLGDSYWDQLVQYDTDFSQRVIFQLIADNGNESLSLRPVRDWKRNYLRLYAGPSWSRADCSRMRFDERWYCIEIKLPQRTASSTTEWWVDGIKMPDLEGVDFSGVSYWKTLSVGSFYCNQAASTHAVCIDELVVTDSYTGYIEEQMMPDVSISVPSRGERVSGSVVVTATAAALSGISKVEFYLDGALESTAFGSPYQWNWNTSAETEGYHRIKAVLTDNSGRTAGSEIPVTVSNTPVTTDEHVWLHVEGRYIRTSPYNNPSNAIWMGGGVAWDLAWPDEAAPSFNIAEGAAWLRARGNGRSNLTRICFQSLPWPASSDRGQGGMGSTLDETIENWLSACVDELKANKVYSILDMHDHAPCGWEFTHSWADCFYYNWNENDWMLWNDHWVAIATFFRDEPWIAAYEIMNEPGSPLPAPVDPSPDLTREKQVQCLRAIREVDTKHIVMLAAHYGWPDQLKPVYEPVYNFRPDTPYNQVCYMIHPYIHKYQELELTPEGFAGKLNEVWGDFNVPLMATEWGYWCFPDNCPCPGEHCVTDQEKRDYQVDVLDIMWNMRIPWTIWDLYQWPGNAAADSTLDAQLRYTEYWETDIEVHASSDPAPGGAGLLPDRVLCEAHPDAYVYANGTDERTVYATISDANGFKVSDASHTVYFSITGAGTWSDGTAGMKQDTAVAGIASVGIRSGTNTGTITVTADAGGLTPGTVDVTVLGTPEKLKLTAEPASIFADGNSFTLITAYVKDRNSNTDVATVDGTVDFAVTGGASLYVTQSEEGSSADISDPGRAYIWVKSGTAAEKVTVTGSMDGLEDGSVTVYIGMDPDMEDVKRYPNPAPLGTAGARVKIEGYSGSATLRIMTLSGRLVKLIEVSSDQDMYWDLKNTDDNTIAPGLYLYVLIDEFGNRKTGKIVAK